MNTVLLLCASILSAFDITTESLLTEMTSYEESAKKPAIEYVCRQISSHDRRSVSPFQPGWFANDDGSGVERTDTVEGRIEKVMFDEDGPGVITRFWLTTIDKRGTMRFYFDGSKTPGWTIPAYDLMLFGIPELGRGLLLPHTSYKPNGKGGNTLFFPIAYAKHCKITFEDKPGIKQTPKYYAINYRTYKAGTKIETFSKSVASRAAKQIASTDYLLQHPKTVRGGKTMEKSGVLLAGSQMSLSLPEEQKAICEMVIRIDAKKADYAEAIRGLMLCAYFDGDMALKVPVSDFSGAGMGGFAVKSWYLDADGKGEIVSRWYMPYKKSAKIILMNTTGKEVKTIIRVRVVDNKWDARSMYFRVTWKQENRVPLCSSPDSPDMRDWEFTNLRGDGMYKGDVMTLNNHSPKWYGEGDEKIYVDGERFPSHFGTGTEDYYNSSWAPVHIFQTPFGGAPRADEVSSHGYNTFFRTRNLDGIPFSNNLRFNLEMLSWEPGNADIATTVFWYSGQLCDNLYKEPYRPQYHFSPKHSWIGDPSGLMKFGGKYHYYWWGKAESNDLVHYNEVSSMVMNGASRKISYFTGSCAIDKNNTAGFGKNAFIAAYTIYENDTKKQCQGISYSLDGREFHYYDNNPVIDLWSSEFRDPTVFWYAPTKSWVMVVAKAREKKVKFYTSKNMKDWTWTSDFGPAGDSEQAWECPDIFQVSVDGNPNNKRWVLVTSINWNKEQYFIGDFDGEKFTLMNNHPQTPLYVDSGLDYYASRTIRDYDGDMKNVVTIGWVATWDYAQQVPSKFGKGFWSIPRYYELKTYEEGLRLIQKPAEELKVLRDKQIDLNMTLPVGKSSLPSFKPKENVYEIEASFSNLSPGNVFGMNLCVGESRKLVISYDTDSKNLFIDRTNCSAEFIPKFQRTAFSKVPIYRGKLNLHIFVDKSSVEIFADDGRKVFTMQIFPSENQTGIELFSVCKGVKLDIKAWNLKSIWR